MKKGFACAAATVLLAVLAGDAHCSVPVWLAEPPPWGCYYGELVRQYGSSFAEAFDALYDYDAGHCFNDCANTPYPPPFTNCRYRYAFDSFVPSGQCTQPGTCFRVRSFDTQNPQNGWQTFSYYFRMTDETRYGTACPDGTSVATDDYGQLACEVPAVPWNEVKNLGMACSTNAMAGNPVNIATGNKVHHELDVPDTSSRLVFERFYNSLDSDDIGLGPGWSSTYHRRLQPSAVSLTVRDSDGKGERWKYSTASQSWVGESDTRIRLLESNGGFVILREDDSVETYHLNGRLLDITSVDGVVTTLGYQDPVNPERLLSVSNSLGESLTFTYTADDHIESVTNQAGNTWTYNYDADQNLEYVYYPDGSTDGFANNPYRHYHYNEPALIGNAADLPNHLTGISDGSAGQERRYASYGYYANGRTRSSYHAGNADRIDIVYDDANGTRTLTNSRNIQSTYTIDTLIGVAQVTDISGPGCAACGAGNSAYYRDPANNNLLYSQESDVYTKYANYDGNGNYRCKVEGINATDPTDLTDSVVCAFDPVASPDARIRYYTYDPRFFSKITTRTGPSVRAGYNRVTAYSYDDFGNRTSETIDGYAPDGQGGWVSVSRTTTWKYGGPNPTDCPESEAPFHQLCEIDGPRTDVNDITTLRYWPFDPQARTHGPNDGRLKEVEDATGVLIRSDIHYTATGKVASETRPNGLNLTYTYYPGNDRLETLTESGGTTSETTRWAYLPTGEVETITTADGSAGASTVTFGYDDARRLVRITDGLGNYTRYTLDTEGNVEKAETFDANGTPADALDDVMTSALTQAFDPYNRLDLVKRGNDPANPLETVDPENNPDGTLDAATDGNGVTTDYSYDALKRLLTATQDPGGSDPATADALTRYGYDDADRLTSVTDPVNGATTYQYDDLDNRISTTSPDTGVTTYGFDDAGNMMSKTTVHGTPSMPITRTLNYSYDALNRLTGVTTPDPQENVSYTYDNCLNGVGRLCSVSNGHAFVAYSYDGFGNVTAHQGVNYTYDLANRIESITYPSGAVVNYGHDPAGRVGRVDFTINAQTRNLASNITYAPFGGIATLNYGNGLAVAQQRDTAYRLTGQSILNALSLAYPAYDGNGNLIQRDDTTSIPKVTSTFGYDTLNRLDTASGPFGSGWDYDYDRNGNRTRTNEGVAVALGYEPNSSRLDSVGSDDVILDLAGNMLARGNWTYSYTPHERLKDASAAAGLVATFAYNGLGQRVEKDPAGSYDKRFFYGPDGALLFETDVNGHPLVEYIYLNDRLLAVYHPDADNNGETNLQAAGAGHSAPASDSDSDGLADIDELLVYGTSPTSQDTDGDGVDDGTEVAYATNPVDPGDFVIPGDINSDGQVGLADYLLLMQYLAGMKTPGAGEMNVADMNRNGQLDAGDAVVLVRKVLLVAWETLSNNSFMQTLLATRDGFVRNVEASVTQGKLYYVHTDHIGTPQVMTDENGNIVWRAVYDPFGKATINVNTVELNVRLPGQYYDQETGLHYNYFRYYDPSIGRYITSDPIGLRGGQNIYSYADSSPVKLSDPLGLATYMCMKPLDYLANRGWDNTGKRTGRENMFNPLHHQFLCVKNGIVSVCGGQDLDRSKEILPGYGGGKQSNDKFDSKKCEQIEPDRNCVEECVIRKIQDPERPFYGVLGPGTNCQEWAIDVIWDCRKECRTW